MARSHFKLFRLFVFIVLLTVVETRAVSSTDSVSVGTIDHTFPPALSQAQTSQVRPASVAHPRRTFTPASVSKKVKKEIARYFGIPLSKFSQNTDLIKDLHADPMDVIEVIEMICEIYDIEPPTRDDITTVGQIIRFILEGPREVKTVQETRTRGISESLSTDHGTPATKQKKDGKEPVYIQKIFYATNRNLERTRRYSGKRASGGQVRYGLCEVSIPVNVHTRGHLEQPSLIKLEWEEDPKKHIVLQKVEALPWNSFLTKLNGKLEASQGDAFVFIHGYNVSFDKAARRTAQIAYDLDFNGAPILFSWPSDGSLLAYFSDREDVEWSVPYIERFLQDLLQQARPRRLHLIAHSMGNQGLIRALYAIALRHGKPASPLFENVILAAPDFDAEVFTDQLAPEIIALANRWTLYASEKDIALDASTALAAKRLGLPISVVSGVDTIDATGIEVSPWSVPELHSYYASKLRVINDVIGVLTGLSPEERKLKKRERGKLVYWEM
jgi:acyl carrier protein